MTDIFVSIIAVIAGCLMCFEGYKLFRLSLAIAGGVAGYALASLIIELTSAGGIAWSDTGKMIMLALFAVVCGVLSFILYMKALIAITTIVCAFLFFDDFKLLFAGIVDVSIRTIVTYIAGLAAGALIGIIVYYAQKWTISLFTAFIGAKIISGVLALVLWSGISSGEYAEMVSHQVLGNDVDINFTLVRIVILVAFCGAGFAIQLKTAKK